MSSRGKRGSKHPGAQKTVKERESLYRMIVSQLKYDGFELAAQAVAKHIASYPPTAPSSRLSHLVELGLHKEKDGKDDPSNTENQAAQGMIDLEYESDEAVNSPSIAQYESLYITSHKAPTLAGAFSWDGQLAASGSADTTIRVYDVDRMSNKKSNSYSAMDNNPILMTLYDHIDQVRALEFHPKVSVLVSASSDCTVKFFDYSKTNIKRAYHVIQEVAVCRCLAFHPSGDYMLVGTDHQTLRLYDVNTTQCFVSANARDQHSREISSVHYTPDARMYCSSSEDGSIKVWDGVSNRCTSTYANAHDGAPVCTVQFSKSSKYILSSGRDGSAVLWEVSTGRPLIKYKPMHAEPRPHELPTCAVFSHTEDFVIMGEERNNNIHCWEARTGELHRPLKSSNALFVC